MTAIVGVLNSQGIAIAADSAVTVSGNNMKKVYNRSNKIFTLSKFHPVGIAIYNSADFMGIPLETIIKMYRKQLNEASFDTIEQYKTDFIAFLKSQLSNVSAEIKKNAFFTFCAEGHLAIINNTLAAFDLRNQEFSGKSDAERALLYQGILTDEIKKYSDQLETFQKATYVSIKFDEYCNYYSSELKEIEDFIAGEICRKYVDFTMNDSHRQGIKHILFDLVNIDLIFESHCGLVFIGFGETEVYPSSHLVLVGSVICDEPRIAVLDPQRIQPGVLNSNILPYAQGDVTTTVLTGVDPNYKNEVKSSVKKAFDGISSEIAVILNNDKISHQVTQAISTISDELIKELEDYQWTKITGPLLEILAHMGKEDMSELAESLVNITSLKRKFTSSDSADESVGGPVDVAIITKGDGFIWMKRKHYFDIESNQTFRDKYFKV